MNNDDNDEPKGYTWEVDYADGMCITYFATLI